MRSRSGWFYIALADDSQTTTRKFTFPRRPAVHSHAVGECSVGYVRRRVQVDVKR